MTSARYTGIRLSLIPILVSFFLAILAGCSDGRDSRPADKDVNVRYRAEITRTEYGIPHIVAGEWGSLGYGHGYAFAQDHFCMLMEEVIRAAGQTLAHFGESGGQEESDFLFTLLNNNDEGRFEQRYLASQPQYVLDLVEGYAAGVNRYLRDTGVDNLPQVDPECRGAPWVREIGALDLWRYFRRFTLQASSDHDIVRRAILDATGPDNGVGLSRASVAADTSAVRGTLFPQPGLGSNGIALGHDATQTGTGMLLGNPHQPWYGLGSFYQAHLTLPGEYDAMGAVLKGFPMIAIGFNQDIAWTHTSSYANRLTLFELRLNPDNPLQYEVDGEWKAITPETVGIRVLNEDGTVETREHTFYHWEHGLIVNLRSAAAAVAPELASLFDGWPTQRGTVYALRDANIDNMRGMAMWIRMARSRTVSELAEAMKTIGNPLFHTLAADRDGNIFYGEISAIPHVTRAQLEDCVTGINTVVAQLTNDAIIALDGHRGECQWGVDEDAPAGSGLYGYGSLPRLTGTGYAANSNDSYWLSDPGRPLEGYPSIMGFLGYEGKQQNLRTQLNHAMVAARLAGTDGFDASPGFTLPSLQRLMYENRVFAAELVLDDVLTLCDQVGQAAGATVDEIDALRGCAQLARWDRRANVDSRGTQVFTEFWRSIEAHSSPFVNALEDRGLWRVGFDPNQPLTTPSGFDIAPAANRERIVAALAAAVRALDAAGVGLGAPWGQVQVLPRDGVDVAIHGGDGRMGVFSDINSALSPGGYRDIRSGSSYIQAVTWDESECPVARAVITTSQSSDPGSPHFSDQSQLYSRKEWVAMPFCATDIDAAATGDVLQIEE